MSEHTDKLESIMAIALLYPRCCDLHQDGFGQFACLDCQQKTFAMMGEIQGVLGISKGGKPLSSKEHEACIARAISRNNAPKTEAHIARAMEILREAHTILSVLPNTTTNKRGTTPVVTTRGVQQKICTFLKAGET